MKTLMRGIIAAASNVAARIGARLRYEPPSGLRAAPLKLNLGCGLAVAPGWLNVDASLNTLVACLPGPLLGWAYRFSGANRYYTKEEYRRILRENVFLHCDLAEGIPLADSSVSFIYTSHFLEHLSRAQGCRLMREMRRVLKPGGIARICVPDLQHALALYGRGDKHKALESYFFVEDMENPFSQHRYMYDFEMLSEALSEAGFSRVERRAYRVGSVPDVGILDNRPEETLYVEAAR